MTRPLPHRPRKYDSADPDRVGTVWTFAGPDGQLMRCANCGDPIDALWEHIGDFRLGHRPPRCSSCRGDERVLAVVAPPASVIAARRAARALPHEVPQAA